MKKYNLFDSLTPNEKSFLGNPTDKLKTKETWKCEGIWILMWALNVVDELAFPNALCNLNGLGADYPISKEDPNHFINRDFKSRSKSEILDMADLYYRYDWACVDARINGRELNELNMSCLLYTSPSPRDRTRSRMPSSA